MRVIKDKKTAFAGSSDLSRGTLEHLMKNAIKRATLASPDEFSGLPSLPSRSTDISSLSLFDPEIPNLNSKKKIALAVKAEKIALADKRITNTHGASFETKEIKTILGNSNGFLQEYNQTVCGLSLGLQAGETDNRVEDYWFSIKRHYSELEPPEEVARKAVQRTTRQLNPRKIKTQKAPVIFEPMMTSWLMGFLFVCVSGISIYQKTSFLVDKLGERIGKRSVNVMDNGLLPGMLGSRPFDAEGVPCKKTPVIENGILKNYLCNTYAARKLKLKSTGNSTGTGVSPNNFYLEAGETPPDKIISSLEKGLILIRTLGHGLNPVTGDISRGAFGLWVENGEITYPVSEITISGNLGEILNNIEMIGNDLEFQSPICGPTIKIQELTVAGE
jgi:PmbA protein